MKLRYTIPTLLLATLLAAVAVFYLTPPVRGIEIFVVDHDYTLKYNAWNAENIPLNSIELPDEPTLVDEDIISYSWVGHRMVLTANGVDKLPRTGEFSVGSRFFILAVNRTPCYAGSLETRLSSMGHACPTIITDYLPSRGGTEDFEIAIDAGYPDTGLTTTLNDLRFNERLRNWLDRTNRL